MAPLPAVTAEDVTRRAAPGALRFWAHLRSAGSRRTWSRSGPTAATSGRSTCPTGYGAGLEASLTNGQLAIRVLRGESSIAFYVDAHLAVGRSGSPTGKQQPSRRRASAGR